MAYATVAELRAWTAGLDLDLPEDDVGAAALLARASADIDQYFHWPPPEDPEDPDAPLAETRLDPANLTKWEAWSLAKATVEQAAYRLIVGEADLIEGRPRTLALGEGVQFARDAPDLLCAPALVSLAGIPSLWRSASGCAPAPDAA